MNELGFFTQEIEDEQHSQQQQSDDGTTHSIGPRRTGSQHVLQTTLPFAAGRRSSWISSWRVTSEEISVRGGGVRWARGARCCVQQQQKASVLRSVCLFSQSNMSSGYMCSNEMLRVCDSYNLRVCICALSCCCILVACTLFVAKPRVY